MNKRSIGIVLVIGFITIPLVLWLVSVISQQGKVEVSLLVLPKDATVKINDQDYSNKKTIHLDAGDYTVVVSKDGFETDTRKVTVKEGATNAIISTPNAVSDEAQQWVKANQNAYLELEGKAGSIATQKGQEFIEKYPLTKWLPLQKAVYTIGYKQAGDGVVVTIDAQNGYREAALQEIRDLGYDPSDYKIEFTNYRNPFNE